MSSRIGRISIAVIWAAACIVLIFMLAGGHFGGKIDMVSVDFSASSELLREEQQASEGVERLNINTGSPSVRLLVTDSGTFSVRHYGSKNTEEQYKVQVKRDGGTLRVTVPRKTTRIFSIGIFSEEYLEITVPRDWNGSVEAETSSGSLRVKDTFSWKEAMLKTSSGSLHAESPLTLEGAFRAQASSGSLHLESVNASSAELQTSSGSLRANGPIAVSGAFRAQTSSGSLHLDALTAESADLKTSSGTLSVNGRVELTGVLTASTSSGSLRLRSDIRAQSVRASTSSGHLAAESLDTETFDLSTTSGGISSDGSISGGGRMKSSSGSIRLAQLQITGNTDISATSGTVTVAVPRKNVFAFEGRCTSGSIRSDYELYYRDKNNKSAYYNNGENGPALRIETSSGSIRLNG